MSITKRIAFGAAASWFSRGVTILLGLVLMPVLFRHLPKEELGVWLLLGQSWAALGIFDLGFGVTLTRRIAFATGKSVSKSGFHLTDDSLNELADLVATGKRVYRGLAVLAFAVSFGSGFFYLKSLHLGAVSLSHVWAAWGILCISQALSVWATIWTCLLQGVGYIGWDAILASLVSALTLLAQIIAVLLGGGLIALAAIAAGGALLQRFLVLGFARRKRPELFKLRGVWAGETVRSMISPALRAWLTASGIVLIHNTDQFFVAGFAGTTKIPAYRAAYLVILNLHLLAGVFAGASFPFIGQLWQAGDLTQVQRIVARNLRIGLLIVMAGVGCVLVLGDRLFNVWLGPGNFIGYPILVIFAITFVLEQQSYILSMGCRATEDEAFPMWTISGGLLKLLFAFLLAQRFGLLGIAVATLAAQVLTNHWYMVVRGLWRLEMNFRDHLIHTVAPCVLVFLAAAGATGVSLRILAASPEWSRVVGGGVAACAVLSIALWFLVFEGGHRRRLAALFVSQ